jgi:cAMP-dependent protein kinase regulator
LRERMEQNFMFNTLNPKDKKAIIEAVLLVEKKANDVIIKEGDSGDNFYLVEDGVLRCSKFLKETDDKETFLREY